MLGYRMIACVCVHTASAQHTTEGYMCLSGPKALWHPNQPNSQLVESETFKEETPQGVLGETEQQRQETLKGKHQRAREKEKGGSRFRELTEGKFFICF